MHARQLLAEAEAIRQYSRTAGLTLDIQNYAAEIKIRAERKAGELLAEMPKQHGARRSDLHDESPPTLSEIGITHIQSHRFQEVASIPEPVFEEAIAETKAAAAATRAEARRVPGAQDHTAHAPAPHALPSAPHAAVQLVHRRDHGGADDRPSRGPAGRVHRHH